MAGLLMYYSALTSVVSLKIAVRYQQHETQCRSYVSINLCNLLWIEIKVMLFLISNKHSTLCIQSTVNAFFQYISHKKLKEL